MTQQPPTAPAAETTSASAPEPAPKPQVDEPRTFDRLREFVHTYWPLLSSFLFLVVTIAIAVILRANDGKVPKDPECDCTAEHFGVREWRVWTATVSAGLGIALVLAIHGIVRLKRIPKRWPQRDGVSVVSNTEVWWHAIAAAAWVCGLIFAARELVKDTSRLWPLDLDWRLGMVATIGVACAIPWIALTWLCHMAVHPYWIQPHTLEENLTNPNTSTRGTKDTDDDIAALQQIWSEIVALALALATLVAISLIPTGALRQLRLSMQVGDDKATIKNLEATFTTTDVLLYGAMWALVASLVVIPLVASWRSTAQSVVDAAVPPNATTAKNPDAIAIRAELESMLNLSSGILRNPLTVLTIATPLVTAAVAAFIPEISN